MLKLPAIANLSSSQASPFFASPLTLSPHPHPSCIAPNKHHRNSRYCTWASSSSSSSSSTAAPPVRKSAPPRTATGPPGRDRKRVVILKPPLDDSKLAERFLASPQLTLKTYPLLSSCLPPAKLTRPDELWIQENILEAKDAMGLLAGMEDVQEGTPLAQLDTLLFLAFQHKESERGRKAPYVKTGHSRLWFLGQYVLELALAELLLQVYPRDTPACLRERAFGLTKKSILPEWIKAASMERLIFPDCDMERLKKDDRENTVKLVFWALIGAVYLTLGMGEVYRLLFEVFGFDLDAKGCQPRIRSSLDDDDYLPPELNQQLTWQEIAAYKPPADALFAHPRLYRACVPTGMYRFRGNLWETNSLPYILKTLEYPLDIADENPEMTAARITELKLGLQLCYMHPSLYKGEHPRFCFERLEYLGQKIQDVIMAEKLLMKHLDGPGLWLQEKHRRLLLNRLCGLYLRDKKLHRFIMYHEERKLMFENRRLRNFTTTPVQQALHGLAYLVYGRAEVRRLMFKVFDFEQLQPRL
ncbi:hypothetical protein O6H91_10G086800 [Diphasiastrum complanatum]|uniref:Uncharacterized protein n=1 Tax=Diphasiastrum complanatum TaxID=34168 RepID=A0ACC2CJA1_DIPCM|nr:hypothetical protein O6H91_10G086800 [Diphasiastrum complanatum]